MKVLIPSLVLFLVVLGTLSCEDRDDNLNAPQIRIQNMSDLELLRVEVRVDSFVYENIAPKGFSDYLAYDLAYQQDVLRIETDSTSFTFTPDSLSKPLPIGLYTYQIDFKEEEGTVLTFKVD
ncbi:MAG: hypothetical protein AAGF77_09860 [Bacteroidota bacterium]